MNLISLCIKWAILFLLLISFQTFSQTTQIQYLSGTGKDHTVDWEFFCTKGSNSGTWTSIAVPSCWEQEGFGNYDYGKTSNSEKHNEQGEYKHSFTIPTEWTGKHIYIVFEGSMTDTEVKINGQLAGDIHQGSFYRFQYDITSLLNFDAENTLEVKVSKMSSNNSVNDAERKSDYWVFGGIFRPVYLKAVPAEFIERTAIDAHANGDFNIDVYLKNINQADKIEVQIENLDGTPVGTVFSGTVQSEQNKITLNTTIANPLTWTAETPNLYNVALSLQKNGEEIHQIKERFGFRTIEVREGDGIYVNGQKIMLKGVNRHSFHPESGRTLNVSLSLLDVELMKEMNMNAVRMSHYPPDIHFLDYCDEKGLYVLDELAGWQDYYDTPIGKRLVKAMVTRDVNHPCIILWNNGNEGGWNTEVDDDFALWDPQLRKVLHPWSIFSNIDTDHYEKYSSTNNKLNGSNIFLPTEFLHGLYDGGHGAGLNDYWKLMMSSPLSAGGFLWTFIDEGIKRSDNGTIDVAGNFAPDGIVGPYREKEASFFTIKEIWSPVYIEMDELSANFTGNIPVENRYSFINLDQCQFEWKLVDFYLPDQTEKGFQIKQEGSLPGPDVVPGSSGNLNLNLPTAWQDHDAIFLTARDHTNKEIYTWTWQLQNAEVYKERIVKLKDSTVSYSEEKSELIIQAKDHEFRFNKNNGCLSKVIHNGHEFAFLNGPVLCSGQQSLSTISVRQEGDDQIVEVAYDGDMKLAQWRINASGWVQLHYEYELNGSYDFIGVSFGYPEDYVWGVKWLGKGPYRVYKNRLKGTAFNVWQKDYNNTITGHAGWEYPEFKGYHANVNWAVLETAEGSMTVVCEEDDMFLHLFTPQKAEDPRYTTPAYPKGDISFLDAIPGNGSKFMKPELYGPEGQQNIASGTYSRNLSFYFNTDGRDESQLTMHKLDIELDEWSGGRVNIQPDSYSRYYQEGTNVTLTASAIDDFTFTGWTGDVVDSAWITELIMDQNKYVIANFRKSEADDFEPFVNINFQPGDLDAPEGYLKDAGLIYGDRGNGFNYGWLNDANPNMRNRVSHPDFLYGTLNHFQRQGEYFWEIAVPNGIYSVFVVMGDADYTDQVNSILIENTSFADPDGQDNFDEYSAIMNISDGKLTLSPTSLSSNAKICFIEIAKKKGITIGIESPKKIEQLNLRQNFPNPFNPSTKINYEIRKSGNVKIRIYDINGRLVKELINENKKYGKYTIVWDGNDSKGNTVATGNYIYQLISADALLSKKMTFIK
jgi:hypothetical protein